MIEYAKPDTEEPLDCREYCSKVFWLTAEGGFKKPPKKRMPRRPTKKQQQWANYHKQQAEIKKANFFKPRKTHKHNNEAQKDKDDEESV